MIENKGSFYYNYECYIALTGNVHLLLFLFCTCIFDSVKTLDINFVLTVPQYQGSEKVSLIACP